MPAERLSMRKIREVLRLKYACGASDRVISRSVGIGRTAIAEYVRRAAVIGISWPIPEEIDDTALERKLFAPAGYNPPRSKPLPDWGHVHAELRRRGVTLALLWEEYRGHHPDDSYGYSRFCDLYVEWRHGITATMRQTHPAGEKLFVNFAGDTMPVFDGLTGEVRAAKIFVAVMGASNYTFAQARFSEALPDWIGAHVDALSFLGGVPKALVCDNLKAGQSHPDCRAAGDSGLEAAFAQLLMLARRVREQKQRQRGPKVYSLRAPEVECIGKGKAHRPYEFGVKVSVATTISHAKGGQFVVHAKALPGNPHDGHTLATVIPDMEALVGNTLARILTDKGYRGHNAPPDHKFRVFISGQKRGVTPAIKRQLRRRSAVEPVIGHLKAEHRMGRNYLWYRRGDAANAVLAAVGYNFRRLIRWLRLLLCQILVALMATLVPA